MNQLLLCGYGGVPHAATALLALTEQGVLIIDVRYHPTSGVPGMSAAALHRLLRGKYCCLPSLGNVNHQDRTAPIRLANEEAGMQFLGEALERADTALLCGCGWKNREACHRTHIARLALARWPELTVEHVSLGDGAREAGPVSETPCSLCSGTGAPWGKRQADAGEKCPRCDGKGVVMAENMDLITEVKRLETLIVTYCRAHMDRVQAEEKGAAPARLAELKRRETYAYNGLANVMIDAESREQP